MHVFSIKDRLPENNTYVLVHRVRGNWRDSDDPQGVNWVVAKFVRGLSLEERVALPDTDMDKYLYCFEDEERHGNNSVPYAWKTFGPLQIFGQDVDYWAPLPVL